MRHSPQTIVGQLIVDCTYSLGRPQPQLSYSHSTR